MEPREYHSMHIVSQTGKLTECIAARRMFGLIASALSRGIAASICEWLRKRGRTSTCTRPIGVHTRYMYQM